MVDRSVKAPPSGRTSNISSHGSATYLDLSCRDQCRGNTAFVPSSSKCKDNDRTRRSTFKSGTVDRVDELEASAATPMSLPSEGSMEGNGALIDHPGGLKCHQSVLSFEGSLEPKPGMSHNAEEEHMHPSIFEHCDVDGTFLEKFGGRSDVDKKTDLLSKRVNGPPFKPLMSKNDFLLRYPAETQRLEKPRTIRQASTVEHHSGVGLVPSSTELHAIWRENTMGRDNSQWHEKPEEADTDTGNGIENSPNDNQTHASKTVERLTTREAVDTSLLESCCKESWKRRQDCHSELHNIKALNSEQGTEFVTVKLLECIPRPKVGQVRKGFLEGRSPLDPFGPGAGPESPLPCIVRAGDERNAIEALKEMRRAAEVVKQSLEKRSPFLDISWSRQPSLNDDSIQQFFLSGTEATAETLEPCEECPVSHGRVQMAAQRVSRFIDGIDTSPRAVKRMVSDVEAMYRGDDFVARQSEGENVQTHKSQSNVEVLPCARTPVATDPSGMGATGVAPPHNAADILDLWRKREERYRAVDAEEDDERLRLLYQIVHDVYEQFGAKWSNRLPRISLITRILRLPQPLKVANIIPNPQAFISHHILDPQFFTELVHSLFVPLSMERFYLFDVRYSSIPPYLNEEARASSDLCFYSQNVPRMGRICHYLLTGLVESRVPGLLRLLFRLNALEFFEYRICVSLHMFSLMRRDNSEPELAADRAIKQLSNDYRDGGVDFAYYNSFVGTKSDELCLRKGNILCPPRDLAANAASTRCSGSKAIFARSTKVERDDLEQLSSRATRLLCLLLRNATSCSAMRYNIEAICKLLPFVGEYTSNMASKETICLRLFQSPLTHAVFACLGSREIPSTPQAISLIGSYLEMLTESLYSMRSSDMMGIINDSKDYMIPALWIQIAHALSKSTHLFLCRALLCVVADLIYLTCQDGAPLLTHYASKMHARLEYIVVPMLKEKKQAAINSMTWDYCLKAAVCLSRAFQMAVRNESIDPKLIYPFTMLSRCGRRGGGPWPSLRNSSWEPSHYPWVKWDEASLDIPSDDEWSKSRSTGYSRKRRGISREKGSGGVDRTLRGSQRCQQESRMQATDMSQHRNGMLDTKGRKEYFSAFAKRISNEASMFSEPGGQKSVHPASLETEGRYNRWKGVVVPCWFPPCKRILFEDMENEASSLEMFYCKECYVASYCSSRCQQKHYELAHSQVCCYFRRPPTFIRFHMLKHQIPQQIRHPLMKVFHDLCDLNFTINVRPEDFKPIF